jgi:hypothetical protein
MDIHRPALPSLNECRCEYTVVARRDDELDAPIIESSRQLHLCGLSVLSFRLSAYRRIDTVPRRNVQRARTDPVAQYEDHLGTERARGLPP